MDMNMSGLLSDTCILRSFRSKRASSWDRTGGNSDWKWLAPGETHVLMQEHGAGCVKHFYWTYIEDKEEPRLNIFRGWVLRMFWDGSDVPSVEVPFGDFFGISNGWVKPISSLAFTTCSSGSADEHASWGNNCYLPMPFADGARIEIENQGECEGRIWYHIDYELYDDAAAVGDDAGRLHAQWNRENPTVAAAPPAGGEEISNLTADENYVILDTAADGQFAGYFLTVVNRERDWWGEGDDMIFIDGESFPPSIHGTGTEEIFGGGACPTKEYCRPYTGFHCIENRQQHRHWGANGMYRFYLVDPIRFRKSIRVTLEHGHGNDKANEYASTSFWYQRGVNPRPRPLAPIAQRQVSIGTPGTDTY